MNMLEILSGMCYSEKDRGNSPVSIDRYFKGTSRFTKGTADNGYYDSWMIVDKTKDRALLFYVQVRARANAKSRFIRLAGLDPERRYTVEGREYTGNTLMQAGVRVPAEFGDFKSRLIEITG